MEDKETANVTKVWKSKAHSRKYASADGRTTPIEQSFFLQFKDSSLERAFQTYHQDQYYISTCNALACSVVGIFSVSLKSLGTSDYPLSIYGSNFSQLLCICSWFLLVFGIYKYSTKCKPCIQLIMLALATAIVLCTFLRPTEFTRPGSYHPKTDSTLPTPAEVLQAQHVINKLCFHVLISLSVISTTWNMQFHVYFLLGLLSVLGEIVWLTLLSLKTSFFCINESALFSPIVIIVLGISLRQNEIFIRQKFLSAAISCGSSLQRQSSTDMDQRKASSQLESGMEGVLRTLSKLKQTSSRKLTNELDTVIQTLISGHDLFETDHDRNCEHEEEVQGWLNVLEANHKRRVSRFKFHSSRRTLSGIKNTIQINMNNYFKKNNTYNVTWLLNETEEGNIDMDIFQLNEVCDFPLTSLVLSTLSAHNIFTQLDIPMSNVAEYGIAIESRYHSKNPYHNAMHAAAVVWDVNFYIKNLESKLNALEIYSAIISAAVHDINHPGVTNTYLINQKSPLAITYSDDSVLERMHLAEAFKLTCKEGCDIFEKLSCEQSREARRLIIDMVLATDLSLHVKHVNILNSKQYGTSAESRHVDTGLVLQSILMMADLGHATKQFAYHEKWSKLITEEFYRQGDLEKENRMAVSPLCDRLTGNKYATSQKGFFNFVVVPLFRAVHGSIPIRNMKIVLRRIEENQKTWHQHAKLES